MNQFQFQTVPNIISGLGSIQQLRGILTARPYQHLLLVTDAGMLKHQLHLPILEILEDLSLTYSIYSEVEADPSEQIVLNAVDYAKQQKVDIVLGFGGGSSMDVAKIIAILSHPAQQQQLSDLYGVNNAQAPRLPLILVPTTAGTGSEVTPISIVTTGETTKTGIVAPVLFADVAILDATFTENLPRHISAATGIDAMVHAIEAYTSKIKKNPYADMSSETGFKTAESEPQFGARRWSKFRSSTKYVSRFDVGRTSLCQCPSRCCSCACLSTGWSFSHFSWTQ